MTAEEKLDLIREVLDATPHRKLIQQLSDAERQLLNKLNWNEGPIELLNKLNGKEWPIELNYAALDGLIEKGLVQATLDDFAKDQEYDRLRLALSTAGRGVAEEVAQEFANEHQRKLLRRKLIQELSDAERQLLKKLNWNGGGPIEHEWPIELDYAAVDGLIEKGLVQVHVAHGPLAKDIEYWPTPKGIKFSSMWLTDRGRAVAEEVAKELKTKS